MLRDYQIEIYENAKVILDKYRLVYLSVKQRVGKTTIALHLANKYTNVLFITKKKAIESGSIQADYNREGFSFNLTLTNYEQVKKLTSGYDCIIVDEAHNYGTFPKASLRWKHLKSISKDTDMIFLSGTPSPESYSQLYHQLQLSSFSPLAVYSSFYRFAKDFINVKQVRFRGIIHNDYSDCKFDKLKKHINHLFVSFTQEQAGFKAKKIEQVITIPLNKSTDSAIKLLKKNGLIHIGNKLVLADDAVKMQIKFQQMFSGTVICEDGSFEILDLSKAMYIKSAYVGKKIAIFYYFRAEKLALEQVFNNLTESQEEFNNSDDKIFYGQIHTCAEGVKLNTADVLVFYNITFSSVKYQQIIDRSQDLYRDRDSLIHWIFSEGGIENYILQTVKNKQNYTVEYFKRDFYDRATHSK